MFELGEDKPKEECGVFGIHAHTQEVAPPDSTIDQLSVSESRRRMGGELAREYPLDVDLVIAVPDSGTASALGYATTMGIPFGDGIIKNRYIHQASSDQLKK